jgi:hypothetical protein
MPNGCAKQSKAMRGSKEERTIWKLYFIYAAQVMVEQQVHATANAFGC